MKYTVEQFLAMLEKFNRDNQHNNSGMIFSLKEREAYELRKRGMTLAKMADEMKVCYNRVYELMQKIKAKEERQKKFIEFVENNGKDFK